jgi:hypothetical protein
VKPKAAAIDTLIENLQEGRVMADKTLQFLDIPRTDPEKLPVEVRNDRVPGDLCDVRSEGGLSAGRAAA